MLATAIPAAFPYLREITNRLTPPGPFCAIAFGLTDSTTTLPAVRDGSMSDAESPHVPP